MILCYNFKSARSTKDDKMLLLSLILRERKREREKKDREKERNINVRNIDGLIPKRAQTRDLTATWGCDLGM